MGGRERALRIALLIVGLLFVAAIYPLTMLIRQEPALAMMMSLYCTLGIFLLLALRNPTAHRSLIAFTGWSSLAHATVMAVQASRHWIARRELIGVGVFFAIGIVLIALVPTKRSTELASAASAQSRVA